LRDAKDAGSQAEAEWERGCLSNGRLTRLALARRTRALRVAGEKVDG
jgi:hypothetical protein